MKKVQSKKKKKVSVKKAPAKAVKKASKKKAASKKATAKTANRKVQKRSASKKKTKGPELVNFKVERPIHLALTARAKKFAKGNLSAWLRHAGTMHTPPKNAVIR